MAATLYERTMVCWSLIRSFHTGLTRESLSLLPPVRGAGSVSVPSPETSEPHGADRHAPLDLPSDPAVAGAASPHPPVTVTTRCHAQRSGNHRATDYYYE